MTESAPRRPQRAQLGGAGVTVTVMEPGLDVDGRLTSWLDIDDVVEGEHRVSLALADGSSMALTGLGTTHDVFLEDLRRARRRMRLPALTVATGDPLVSWVSRDGAGIIDVHLFAKVLVLEPRRGQPTTLPLPLVDAVERDGFTVTIRSRGLEPVVLRALGPKTDDLVLRLRAARQDLQAAVCTAYVAAAPDLEGYVVPDGWAVERGEAGPYWGPLHSLMAGGDRAAEVAVLESIAGPALRAGLYTDGGASSLPFVLAPVGGRVAVESADEQARATYVFALDPVRLNAVLLLTSFRREALYLPDDQLGRWAVAARTSPVIRDARAALVARVVHDASWEQKLRAALTA